MSDSPVVRFLGRVDYLPTLAAMRTFTEARDAATRDEIWLCEHPPVYTQGVAGRPEHVLDPHGIAVVQTDRGGQVTYHGPGQVVAYPLVDMKRLGIFVKEFVYRVEHCVLRTLEHFEVTGHRVPGAPGVYVNLDDPVGHGRINVRPLKEQAGAADTGNAPWWQALGKIAALGIKVSRHCTYHGVALNVAMDLGPFEGIHACGYPGLRTIDLATLGVHAQWAEVAERLADRLAAHLVR